MFPVGDIKIATLLRVHQNSVHNTKDYLLCKSSGNQPDKIIVIIYIRRYLHKYENFFSIRLSAPGYRYRSQGTLEALYFMSGQVC